MVATVKSLAGSPISVALPVINLGGKPTTMRTDVFALGEASNSCLAQHWEELLYPRSLYFHKDGA
jgi:hypothetical protein